jgi:hypothetical protein
MQTAGNGAHRAKREAERHPFEAPARIAAGALFLCSSCMRTRRNELCAATSLFSHFLFLGSMHDGKNSMRIRLHGRDAFKDA